MGKRGGFPQCGVGRMSKTDSEYFTGRLTAERKAAAQCTNKAAKAAHEALAHEYESRLRRVRPAANVTALTSLDQASAEGSPTNE